MTLSMLRYLVSVSALTSSDRVDVRSQCVLWILCYAGGDDLLSGALHLHDSWSGPGPRSL